MNKSNLYNGTISIEGTHRTQSKNTTYHNERFIEGNSLGQLLDNMVTSTVDMARNANSAKEQMAAEDKNENNDAWTFGFSYPDIFNVDDDDAPASFHGTVTDINKIIVTASHVRHFAIWYVIIKLNQTRNQMKLEPFTEEFNEFKPVFVSEYEAAVAGEGLTGSAYDSVVAIAEKDGSFSAFS